MTHTLNIENLNKLIDTFKRLYHAPLPEYPDKGFSMRWPEFVSINDYSSHQCGTAACIMGWQVLVLGAKSLCDDVLADNLGMTPQDHTALTCPSAGNGCLYAYNTKPGKFTLPAAITVLERLRDHGLVDWNYAIEHPWQPMDNGLPRFDTSGWLKQLALSPDAKVLFRENPHVETADG